MAIEIKELVVKITLTDQPKNTKSQEAKISNQTKTEIVNECVKRVLETLEAKSER
ncbi:MAG: DUF5908 family protein [Microscillaceae bacterium]|jgi:hypothetical protein|nr:DUF5908 family protein [Microscillaceae bacterium]